MSGAPTPPRVLAVASAGGHFVQLCRLMPALDGCLVSFASTDAALAADVRALARSRGQPAPAFHRITEANRWQKLKLCRSALEVALILLRSRPDVVITTGAAPGYLALRMARLIGARTVWIDSVANAEELSLSGRKIGPHADLWLTQWEHLAREDGPRYEGSVL